MRITVQTHRHTAAAGLAGEDGEVEEEECGGGEQRGQRERAGEGGEHAHSGREVEERVQDK
jgi:hypothetical protein